MITVSICEDEGYFISKLEKLVDEYCSVNGICASVQTFTDGEGLLASGQASDIILMDIKLPGADGMEIVRCLREHGGDSQVIFITAYSKYVFGAFDLDAVHYILKPVSAQKFFGAMDRAVKRILSDKEKALLITGQGRMSKIAFKDILYCEAMDHQITVHTPTGQTQFFGTLDAVQEKLDGRFFRCHRSYIVNMDCVTDKQQGVAVVTGGDRVLVARRKQREFTQKLLESCRKGMI